MLRTSKKKISSQKKEDRMNSALRPSRARLVFVPLLALAIFVVAPATALTQGLQTATVSGVITDESGAIMPGVMVTMVNLTTNQSRDMVTNGRGAYRLDGLTPSKYSLKAELQGFATIVQPEITVNVGVALDINLVMKVSSVSEMITVSGESPIIQAEKVDLSRVITKEQIENLPVNGRNYIDFALLTPTATPNVSTVRQGVFVDIGSARSYQSQLVVDGFWNTDELFGAPRHLYSQDAVQEFQVVSMGGSAEFGRAIGGVISAVTKSGGNAFNGSVFGYFRDTDLNSRTVFERLQGLPKSAFNRKQYGATLGGPIARDKTFFFASIERSNENTPYNNLITAENARIIGLPPEDAGTTANFRRILFWMGKVDHNVTKNQRLQASYVQTHHENFGQRNEPFATRARQTHQDLHDYSVQAGWQNVAGNWLHEIRGSYFPRNNETIGFNAGGPPLVPVDQLDQLRVPKVSITNVANFGSSNINNRQRTRPVQAIYSSSVFARGHSIKFGADVMHAYFDYYLYTNVPGSYSFRTLSDYLAGRWATFSQQFGDPRLERSHSFYSGFVQDSWSATDRLTMNYGVRYDLEVQPSYQDVSFGHDYNNVGPRFGLSYDLTGKGKTFLKASSGIYYDRLFLNFTTGLFYNLKQSPQLFSATWNFGQAGAPVFPNNFAEVPANPPLGVRNLNIVPDPLKTPASGQAVVTLDHAFATNWALSATMVHTRGWDESFTFDRNLQFDDGSQTWVRPEAQYRSVNQLTFIGRQQYTALIFDVRKRMSHRFSLNGNATFARSYDTGTSFGATADDQRFFDSEWGESSDKPHLRAVISGIYQIANFVTLSGIYSARTGLAVDPRSGSASDPNGDGRFNDRTPGFDRNSFRSPGSHNVDMRLAWNVALKGPRRAQFLLEAFNVLNRDNVFQVSETYGPTNGQPLTLFLQPTAYAGPRQIQFGLRFTF